MSDLASQIVETWSIHNRIHLYLLDAIEPESLKRSLNVKGRTVGQLFAHVHNVRLMWLKPAAAELLDGLEKLPDDATHAQLVNGLKQSSRRIESLIGKSVSEGGKIKSFKRGVVPFVGYLISHESHHRGQIGWILKHAGHPLDRTVAFGMWDWNAR